MAVAITEARWNPRLKATRLETIAAGRTTTLAVDVPSASAVSGVSTNRAFALTCTKMAVGRVALVASTPQTLDLTALSASLFSGDLDFTSTGVRAIWLENEGVIGDTPLLLVGNDGTAAEWYDPIGNAAGAVLPLRRGQAWGNALPTGLTAWAVGTRKLLKLTPDASAINVNVVILG